MSAQRRIIAITLAAGALVAGAWGVAQASPRDVGSGTVITALPAKAALLGNQTPAQFVKVTLPVPAGAACATDLTTRVLGQRDAVTVSAVDCSVAGSATWTVTANAVTVKRHAVVKFVNAKAVEGQRRIGTLGVKVNPAARPARPSHSPKPTHSARPNRPVQASPSPSVSVTPTPTPSPSEAAEG